MKNKGSFKSNLFAATAIILIFIGVVGFIMWLLQRVSEGKGTDLYQSHWGINFSAIGVLITLACVVVAAAIGMYFAKKHQDEEKDFLKKYGKNRDGN